MGRPLFPYFFWAALLGLPTPWLAQPSLPEDDIDLKNTDIKVLAKAAFASSQATPHGLARARLDAARTQFEERYEKYRAGAEGVWLDLLLESAASLAEAELGVLEKPAPADRLVPLAAHWLFALSAGQIVEDRYCLGRVSLADFMQARQTRLDAEIKLRGAVAGRKLPDPFLIPTVPLDGEEPLLGPDAKEVAKSAFKAGQADLHDLALVRTEAARTQLRGYVKLSRIGETDTTVMLRKSAARLAEAELGALENPTPAERLKPLAAYWLFTRTKEAITGVKYHVGRISLADFAQAQHARLGAEIKLRGAGAGQQLSEPFLANALPFGLEGAFYGLDTQWLAKSAFGAGRADLRDLAQARRDAIRTCFRERYEKYRTGDLNTTLDLLLEASRLLLQAELDVHADPAKRLEAQKRHWEQLCIAEEIVRGKYAIGRASRADYAQVRYERLDAEIHMLEARAKNKAK